MRVDGEGAEWQAPIRKQVPMASLPRGRRKIISKKRGHDPGPRGKADGRLQGLLDNLKGFCFRSLVLMDWASLRQK